MPIKIKQTQRFEASNGSLHDTFEDAQLEEIRLLFVTNPRGDTVTEAVFAARVPLLEILAQTPRKKRAPKAAKEGGAK